MESYNRFAVAEVLSKDGVVLKVLRLLPVILTTVLFMNRVAQFYAITTFMPPHMPHAPASSTASKRINAAPVLKIWLRTSVARVFPGVLAVVMLLRLTLLLNIFVRPSDFGFGYGRITYGLSFILSFAHLPLAPKMLRIENRMKSPQTGDDEIVGLLQGWFKINNIRIWAVDFPLWLVSIAAIVNTIRL
ncbi:hypothetical protein AUEXF2481DRAFT_9627 [Aureobasidium subglaciale EXF-2481]|uniref:Uncharacterized protein n=1 Tax=Aureobasidium subglaciale (strain EXF-2481) TaxID=1043005 RepID=A0A074XXM4_AURSE|nr:uncharacterized protein AUEXF2481DRAFT_9627 [Aureobasidium subglaciale EXF-2481]KAI5194183.1 hypothetical protein E4T38_09670 [Aureobasidium subglaciale]KAI5213605.1 hypothetical protein E4T40_09612 [Aureobasidium subglaciale]KAI5215269.1 hypothetical protein E4T41_09650 [Aureobasidium subglaciale]KAI5253260.1 hypothetical protein E4T46_09627 [Aureobasidium subglaciale]KEQ90220.1 hypothetical protein AUEXF2481DRAFT_9627 [Aureobasidium subglaciale EXF-2481]